MPLKPFIFCDIKHDIKLPSGFSPLSKVLRPTICYHSITSSVARYIIAVFSYRVKHFSTQKEQLFSAALFHPRACRECGYANIIHCVPLGSPPRVRGKLSQRCGFLHQRRITPACAGKTQRRNARTWNPADHPRVCGENCVFRSVRLCLLIFQRAEKT